MLLTKGFFSENSGPATNYMATLLIKTARKLNSPFTK